MSINVEEIKRIIVDQREETEDIFKKERIIEREIHREELLRFLAYPNILVISGIRRSGKSIASWMLLEGRKCGYINFDDERLAGFEGKDFNKVLSASYELYGKDVEFFIFDEIQNISGWELFMNRLRRTKKVILTGSNANLLSGELSTYLTGRYIDFILYPFSFREFLKIKSVVFKKEDFYSTKSIAQIKNSLHDYLSLGGFPEIHKFGKVIINKIYSDIINKDILFRYKIKHKAAFKELAKYLVSDFTKEVVFNKLKNEFSIKNVHTVKNYIDYLGATYLIFLVEKFSFKVKQQMISPKKVYCIDTGIINSVAFQFSGNEGRLIENIVAVELYRRRAYLNRSLEIYYWKNYREREVDFVLKEGRRVKKLLQVCYDLRDFQVKERELKSLIEASKELRCNDLSVITWDEEKEEEYKGKIITFIPLWKWLLL